jgi:hypothetical protein
MTSARAFDGGFYSPYSETPIYDRLVAERGRPQIGPMHVPAPDFTGLGHYSRFGDRPALPALPALPSSNSVSTYGGSSYASGSYPAQTGGYAATSGAYSAVQYGGSPYANAAQSTPGYAPAPAPPAPMPFPAQPNGQYAAAPQPAQSGGYPVPQGYRPAPGAPQGYRPAPGAPQQYGGQVPPPRMPGRPDPTGFQDRY